MVTDPRTGVRSITPARETFAVVAIAGLSVATILRGIAGRPGGIAGAIVTLMALAILSRYRVSWDQGGIAYQTPVFRWRRLWSELDSYSFHPEFPASAIGRQRNSLFGFTPHLFLRLHGRRTGLQVRLTLFSSNDIRHLADRVGKDLILRGAAALVSEELRKY